MLLRRAQDIAIETGHRLMPYCSKLNIAGSVRRHADNVNDIEIICLPKKQPAGQGALFNEAVEVAVIPAFTEAVRQLGVSEMGNPNGRQMKILLPQGIKLDLFLPQEDDYYRIYAIRTGSRLYSNLVIASSWKKKGWCGTEHGLRRIEDCQEIKRGEQATWKLINPDGPVPPVWTSEQEFFAWLDVPYIEPRYREIASVTATNQKQSLNQAKNSQ
jgi:DNA polymerase/3'-5' exonuclease PolX